LFVVVGGACEESLVPLPGLPPASFVGHPVTVAISPDPGVPTNEQAASVANPRRCHLVPMIQAT